MGMFERMCPYPLRAARLSISFTLFPWLRPQAHWSRNLTESAKRDGETIWYVRWLWVQISYSRWA